MKKSLLCLLFSFLFFHVYSQQQYRVVTIGFYNLENLYDTINDPKVNDDEFTPAGAKGYNGEVFKDKIGKLSDVLSLMATEHTPEGVAILGVAEIENRSVLEALVNTPKLKARNYRIIHYDSPDLRGVDVGMLYNPKYFKEVHSEPLFVRLAGDEGKGFFTRDILFVEGIFMGEPLYVFVNHWPSRRGGEEASAPARAAAASVARHKIDSITAINPNAKIVLMGDLNDEPVSPSVTKVLGAKGKIDDVQAGGMYNPWVDFYKRGIGTSAYQDSWGLFDQIMISSGFLDKQQAGYYFHKAVIFQKEFMLQKTGKYKGYPKRTYDGSRYIGGYSDHFPTYLIFVKPVR